jgi:hypothetical protein
MNEWMSGNFDDFHFANDWKTSKKLARGISDE